MYFAAISVSHVVMFMFSLSSLRLMNASSEILSASFPFDFIFWLGCFVAHWHCFF